MCVCVCTYKTPSIKIYHPAVLVSSVVRRPFPVSNVHTKLLDFLIVVDHES